MAVDFLSNENIWFEKFKYDDAERRFYEQQVNGPAGSSSHQQENGASTILRDIARARENIQKSLAGVSTRALTSWLPATIFSCGAELCCEHFVDGVAS
ncbi:hypothetical protein CIB84_012509 [Bambusicola thoracicus]|uniref:Elongation factor 1-delta n=1 Tax=Bambusicola thoracicus TaxID=9083 RepID=A0A2P4SI29_BAMTH|nr:hypothetical protein CIB84_012509 [Bambusicola thoracicus]